MELAKERALGHHGRVVVEGVIDVDGRYSELRVRMSSRASSFDELALKVAVATIFRPARDAQGVPMATWAVFPFETQPASFVGGTVFAYRCDAAVRDYDWWRGAWPERTDSQYGLFNLVTGIELVALRNAPTPARAASKDMTARWEAAMAVCRTTPTMNFLAALNSPLAK